MEGYKAFEDGLKNRYGFEYELGKKYKLKGRLRWKENGFHFCKRPEDTLRYIDAFNHDYTIAEVNGSGQTIWYEDSYNRFYDMFAASEIEILKIVPRDEIFDMIINSNEFRVKRLIELSKLNDYEIEIIKNRYPQLMNTIDYYQNEEFCLKRKREF